MFAQRTSIGRIALRGRRPALSGSFRAQWQRLGRRGYAASESGGAHPVKKAGSDLPWLITSVGITVPVCWYLLQQKPSGGHGLSHHHDAEHENPEGKHDEETVDDGEEHVDEPHDAGKPADEAPAAEEADDGAAADAGDDHDKVAKGPVTEEPSAGHAAPEASSDEHHDDHKAEDPQDKASQKEEAVKEAKRAPETASVSPDASKKVYNPDDAPEPRVQGPTKREYPYGYPPSQNKDAYPKIDSYSEEDKPGTAMEARSENYQSGKQEKLSNRDTKYSWDLNKDENFSKKSEGEPESAKVKGTVDSRRPAS
ncbi:MAG: hypothetical protein M1823_005175 [Watsoniomyces obsoletus]|nr:MAG: hypothetical protein M1823_005175 [Watsoniomyces obsoletus]